MNFKIKLYNQKTYNCNENLISYTTAQTKHKMQPLIISVKKFSHNCQKTYERLEKGPCFSSLTSVIGISSRSRHGMRRQGVLVLVVARRIECQFVGLDEGERVAVVRVICRDELYGNDIKSGITQVKMQIRDSNYQSKEEVFVNKRTEFRQQSAQQDQFVCSRYIMQGGNRQEDNVN